MLRKFIFPYKCFCFLDENIKTSGGKGQLLNGTQVAALERRVRQELEEQGILAAEEVNVPQVLIHCIIFIFRFIY